jgi:signal transduction histidine kinase
MGMGLAVCRSIIDAHQGRLWAMSDEAAGTTFSFILPI